MQQYQVIFQIPDTAVPDFDTMIAIEEELIESMSGVAEVDGHDPGAGTINYFVITADPTQAFSKGKSVFESRKLIGKLRSVYCMCKHEVPSGEYLNLWPPGASTQFQLLDPDADAPEPALPPWIMYSNPKHWRTGKGAEYVKNWVDKFEAQWNRKLMSVPAEIRNAAPASFDEPKSWIEFRKSIK